MWALAPLPPPPSPRNRKPGSARCAGACGNRPAPSSPEASRGGLRSAPRAATRGSPRVPAAGAATSHPGETASPRGHVPPLEVGRVLGKFGQMLLSPVSCGHSASPAGISLRGGDELCEENEENKYRRRLFAKQLSLPCLGLLGRKFSPGRALGSEPLASPSFQPRPRAPRAGAWPRTRGAGSF